MRVILPFFLANITFSGFTSADPLLAVLDKTVDLSTFSSLIQKTGGSKPNPALFERFNSALDNRNYTAFVPTNSAFETISPSILTTLSLPQNYELLLSIIRTHLAEGLFSSSQLEADAPILSIEGFPILFTNDSSTILEISNIAADNGQIQKLSKVLNPYTEYFGVSNLTKAPSTGTNVTGTMKDVLASDRRLSILNIVLGVIDPEYLTRLSLTKPGNASQVFFAPSNYAFSALPNGARDSMTAPSNALLSAYLLRYGLLAGDTKSADISPGMQVMSVSFLEMRIKQAEADAVVMINNAGVVERDLCAENGCIWVLDRLIDPLFGAF
ncbi:uncharacterized protein PAC_06068 [Phialocephala subalpina]|uniref:FAS1 domain-containing protein n=1 Tax=Phialocephala subalpina TaxID=576137 RepID=A0A1L7WTW1_9HELO|nr:uncharacterized protein PAC_06068 [Phialocephala subalpina]